MDKFEILSDIITARRSVKPANMNGKIIPEEQVKSLFELADWAPTHGKTEPWRFVVYAGNKVKEFSYEHAELYKKNTASDAFQQAVYDKLFQNGDNTSHIVVAYMQRGNLPKIPALEEIVATAAAVEHILLGATALGIASFLSTGGQTHNQAMKDFLHLRNEDVMIGIIYLGYTDSIPEGKRSIPLEEKVKWFR
jgi:nitroreductase